MRWVRISGGVRSGSRRALSTTLTLSPQESANPLQTLTWLALIRVRGGESSSEG